MALTSVLPSISKTTNLHHLTPHHLAHRANNSTEDTIAITLHATLSHLDHPGNYVKLLFIDFSSAFDTIKLNILLKKAPPPPVLGLKTSSQIGHNK